MAHSIKTVYVVHHSHTDMPLCFSSCEKIGREAFDLSPHSPQENMISSLTA